MHAIVANFSPFSYLKKMIFKTRLVNQGFNLSQARFLLFWADFQELRSSHFYLGFYLVYLFF
jgi:hypothetical protein